MYCRNLWFRGGNYHWQGDQPDWTPVGHVDFDGSFPDRFHIDSHYASAPDLLGTDVRDCLDNSLVILIGRL